MYIFLPNGKFWQSAAAAFLSGICGAMPPILVIKLQ